MLLIVSFGLFLLSLLLIVGVIVRLPEDYFLSTHKHYFFDPRSYPNLHWVCKVVRNTLGGIMLLFGIVMLVLPGPGLLTIVIAILLMDFSTKQRFLRRLVSIRSVRVTLNFLRRKMGKPPFCYP